MKYLEGENAEFVALDVAFDLISAAQCGKGNMQIARKAIKRLAGVLKPRTEIARQLASYAIEAEMNDIEDEMMGRAPARRSNERDLAEEWKGHPNHPLNMLGHQGARNVS